MENLQIVWYVLWSVLWIAYFVTDGFDLGAGILMNFISKKDNEKRAVINSIGPFWDGNEVWLITAGGATFAAFPGAYADMFSWLYVPLFLILFGLIMRGVAFELRGKTENHKVWDFFIFLGSLLPAALLGAAFGNLWAGLPIGADGYKGGLLGLLNLSGLLVAISLPIFLCLHGLLWLSHKIEGELSKRIKKLSNIFWYASIFTFVIFILLLPIGKNPNFEKYSVSGILCVLFYIFSAIALISVKKMLDKDEMFYSFMASFSFLTFWFAAGFAGQYPNILPSTLGFNVSAFNASSSYYTLKLMTFVALVFVPIVIGYQIWVYKLLNHKINPDKIETLHY